MSQSRYGDGNKDNYVAEKASAANQNCKAKTCFSCTLHPSPKAYDSSRPILDPTQQVLPVVQPIPMPAHDPPVSEDDALAKAAVQLARYPGP